jgi:hypothetical protein
MTGTRHRQPIYYEVVKFLQENPLRDGHKCAHSLTVLSWRRCVPGVWSSKRAAVHAWQSHREDFWMS